MKNGEGRLELRMSDVRIKLGDLPGSEQSFVNHGARGERTEIDPLGSLCLGPFAKQKKLAFESFAGFVGAEKTLLNRGERCRGGRSEDRGVHRNFAPAATSHATKTGKLFYRSARFIFLTRRQKGHPDPEFHWQIDALFSRTGAEELFRDGKQQTGAVTA
jgi:hypothetical protein